MEKYIKLTDGSLMPRLGQGTWFLGENARLAKEEAEALRAGIDAGMELIDTAEMYGSGRAEMLIAQAIKGYDRDKLYIVSKVYPHNAGRKNIFKSCENSLRRMNIDYMDMYLLHWRGSVPLAETAECMEELVTQGKIKRWGVSNLDTYDMKELMSVKNGKNCCVDQVLYHLGSRGIEYDLMPYLKERGIPVMAYCPLAQGGSLRRGLLTSNGVIKISEKYKITPEQVLLAFVLNNENTIAIPRSGKEEHARQNAQAINIDLTAEDMALLNGEFPSPTRKQPLDIV